MVYNKYELVYIYLRLCGKSDVTRSDRTESCWMFPTINAPGRDWCNLRPKSPVDQSASTPVTGRPISCPLSAHRLSRMGVWGWGDSAGKGAFFKHLITCGTEFTGESRLLSPPVSVCIVIRVVQSRRVRVVNRRVWPVRAARMSDVTTLAECRQGPKLARPNLTASFTKIPEPELQAAPPPIKKKNPFMVLFGSAVVSLSSVSTHRFSFNCHSRGEAALASLGG